MNRIRMVPDDEAAGELAEIYTGLKAASRSGAVPEIMRTMSSRPDVLRLVSQLAATLHFSAGALSYAQHEMIAAHVSALNRCHY